MAYKTTKILIRPNTDIPFYRDAHPRTAEHLEFMKVRFTDTGKLIDTVTTVSEDGLVCFIEATWDSIASWQEFATDPYCIQEYITPAQEYDLAHEIVSTSSAEEI